MTSHIPKRIIQTGKHIDNSVLSRAAIANLRLLNPDFEYMFFDDDAVELFIDREFHDYRQAFEAFQFRIQRYDFFRYLAVYRLGGFYFDLDVLLAEGLSNLLQCGCVFPFEGLTLSHHLRNSCNMDWQLGNYAFGAAPGHPFLKAIIDNCLKAQADSRWVWPMMNGFPPLLKSESFVLNSTGPGLISRTLAEDPELAQSVTVLFPDGDVCDPKYWNRFGELGVHLMDGSWRGKGSWARRRVALLWQTIRFRSLIKGSKTIGETRRHPPQSMDSLQI